MDAVCSSTIQGIATAEEKTLLDALEENCRLVVAKHGLSALECGHAYLLYGKALIEDALSSGQAVFKNPFSDSGVAEEDDGLDEDHDSEDENGDVNGEEETDLTEEENEVTNLEIAFDVLKAAVSAFEGHLVGSDDNVVSIRLEFAQTLVGLGRNFAAMEERPYGIATPHGSCRNTRETLE
ncbi:hypothetical protein HDE_01741 [Halotydeus destructor]|nr:hypothetical protein HDE_01741 [Halotydeus destructor]